MFEESRSPLNDESPLSVMVLADEYQCVNLIKQCINETEITPGNVLEILLYAVKYHQTSLPVCSYQLECSNIKTRGSIAYVVKQGDFYQVAFNRVSLS